MSAPYGRLLAALPLLLFSLTAAAEPRSERTIAVRLLDLSRPTEVTIAANGGDLRLFAGDYENAVGTLRAGEELHVKEAADEVLVSFSGRSLYLRKLRIEPAPSAVFSVEAAGRASKAIRYHGILRVEPDPGSPSLLLVNEVPLDDYVGAVVAREYGFDEPEGLKAMAVVIRTYALSRLGRHGGAAYDHVDHSLSQIYRGLDDVSEATRRAVEATRGEVLMYDGSLIEAVHFASSGGHTADNESVWKTRPVPYLRGKPDPYDDGSPYASWTSRVSRPKLLRELSAKYGATIEGFHLGEAGRDHRVESVDLLTPTGPRTISANDFRMVVTRAFGINALRSTYFTARRTGDEYIFEGRGFGHGVGLNQWGARNMAKRGIGYRDILSFYFTGVELVELDETSPPTPAYASEPVRQADPAPTRRWSAGSEWTPERPTPPEVEESTRPTRRIGW